ncbi:hypothetical protein BCR42DRAFT_394865 [Absidia repens]|uniref:Uncharacterized protein n=1 Tax=Absidia repens TaxID=90262 RepID=A0A1X2I9Y1_9FUNG|nr:hypothetical protein BCR42DRAFT_394865 [Absidia repens]
MIMIKNNNNNKPIVNFYLTIEKRKERSGIGRRRDLWWRSKMIGEGRRRRRSRRRDGVMSGVEGQDRHSCVTSNFQFIFDFNITVTHNVVFVALLNGGIYELVSLFAAELLLKMCSTFRKCATNGLRLVRATGEVGTLPNVIGLITIVKFHDCTAMARIKQSCTSFCGAYQVILAEELGGNRGRRKGMRDLDSWSCPTAFHTYHFRKSTLKLRMSVYLEPNPI